jgi:hypothetical protein
VEDIEAEAATRRKQTGIKPGTCRRPGPESSQAAEEDQEISRAGFPRGPSRALERLFSVRHGLP